MYVMNYFLEGLQEYQYQRIQTNPFPFARLFLRLDIVS